MARTWSSELVLSSSVIIVIVLLAPNIIHTQSLADYSINECRNVPDGIYALRNLSEYMVCQDSKPIYQSCPPHNEFFHPATNSCVPLANITEASFCDDRSTGDWAYPWDCHKYIHCYFNWYQVNSCANNTIYDAVTDSCVDVSLKRNDSICVMSNNTVPDRNATISNGNVTVPDRNVTLPERNVTLPERNVTLPERNVTLPEGNVTLPEGNVTLPEGNITLPEGNITLPEGNITVPEGNITAPGGNTTSSNSTSNESDDLISLAEVQRRLSSKDSNAIILIDVRMPWELKTEGKIGGSYNIPLPHLEGALQMDDGAFKAKYGIEKPSKTNCNLVFHCKSGVRSQRAVDLAKDLGYTCPKSMDGGFDAWKKIYQK